MPSKKSPRSSPRPARGVEAILRPRPLLEALRRHEVRFVLIGGVAERLLGSPRTTNDLDICPATDSRNLARLADALNELGAVYRPGGLESGFPTEEPWSAKSFSAFQSLALVTRYGWLDLVFRPDGSTGYSDLIQQSRDESVGGLAIKVADVSDLIRIKEAIGTPEYLAHLPLLYELRDERKRGEIDR
jgi:hypothetical protein